jgi:hypothetical protein
MASVVDSPVTDRRFLLNVSRSDVVQAPFPHVISDAILPAELFVRLKADYPDASVFEGQQQAHGTTGSRTGAGLDVYRGEPSYARLMARSEAWREFDAFVNSRAFVDQFLDLFGPDLDRLGCSADIAGSVYDRSYEEPRELLTEHATLKDRIDGAVHKLTRSMLTGRKVELFTRLDIQRAIGGYAKKPHCDRPNRLCSLIVYFTDAEATGLEGGELLIYKHRQDKPMQRYERHPHDEDVEVVAKLKPQANRGVFFPCCNNSYHGVTAVTSSGIPRDFLYINISAKVGNVW